MCEKREVRCSLLIKNGIHRTGMWMCECSCERSATPDHSGYFADFSNLMLFLLNCLNCEHLSLSFIKADFLFLYMFEYVTFWDHFGHTAYRFLVGYLKVGIFQVHYALAKVLLFLESDFFIPIHPR